MVQSIESSKKIYTGQVEQAVTGVFKTQQEVDAVVRRLLDIGVTREDISIVGRNFESNSRVAGFLTRGDVIRGGLVNGALYGAFFGSVLSLLTGIGVLFIPFVGPVVAAGPLGAALLGAASGALAGSLGSGLASVFISMGMPEEKVSIYQTRMQAGEFVVVAEGLTAQIPQIETVMAEGGGEEIMVMNQTLPREKPGAFDGPEDLAPQVREHLSPQAQTTYINRYNEELTAGGDDAKADMAAWETVRQTYRENANGVWA
ncbi:ChaB family protein [Candidatus Cyanaurora vandensis]|uniref:ChaB family protein n=1 Tax=Candidatus Cyanaurora vandensis TaxID=2714958 RepID=UPI0025796D9F|nr:ChaB family protein [Candidatus Cyanaurora vandensis]